MNCERNGVGNSSDISSSFHSGFDLFVGNLNLHFEIYLGSGFDVFSSTRCKILSSVQVIDSHVNLFYSYLLVPVSIDKYVGHWED